MMRTSRFKTKTFLAVLMLVSSLPARESVRGELSRLQKEHGLALAWYYVGVSTAHFADRSVVTDKGSPPTGKFENALLSPDGRELAFPVGSIVYSDVKLSITHRDGSIVREFPELGDARAVCWSHDSSKLVVRASTTEARTTRHSLVILNLASGIGRQFGDADSYATNQCWSPDDKQVVYTAHDEVLVYDLQRDAGRTLTHGGRPTWSPDGQWIAFNQGNRYSVISPSSAETKGLFESKQARSELWWSPDSRMVAYLGEGGTLLETLRYIDVGLVQIRVRRLADGAEDWVYQTPDVPPAWFITCLWLRADGTDHQAATSQK